MPQESGSDASLFTTTEVVVGVDPPSPFNIIPISVLESAGGLVVDGITRYTHWCSSTLSWLFSSDSPVAQLLYDPRWEIWQVFQHVLDMYFSTFTGHSLLWILYCSCIWFSMLNLRYWVGSCVCCFVAFWNRILQDAFVGALADDYKKWATDAEYRTMRAGVCNPNKVKAITGSSNNLTNSLEELDSWWSVCVIGIIFDNEIRFD